MEKNELEQDARERLFKKHIVMLDKLGEVIEQLIYEERQYYQTVIKGWHITIVKGGAWSSAKRLHRERIDAKVIKAASAAGYEKERELYA